MPLPKIFTKAKKTSFNDRAIKDKKGMTKAKMTNTTSTKPKKTASLLSLPRELRQQILILEFNAYVPLEVTYRRRGETLVYIDKLAELYKRAIPECVNDVDYVAKKANEAVEELLGNLDYYC